MARMNDELERMNDELGRKNNEMDRINDELEQMNSTGWIMTKRMNDELDRILKDITAQLGYQPIIRPGVRNRTKQHVRIADDLTAIPIKQNTMLRHCYELYTSEDYSSTIAFSSSCAH